MIELSELDSVKAENRRLQKALENSTQDGLATSAIEQGTTRRRREFLSVRRAQAADDGDDDPPDHNVILRRREVQRRTGLGTSTLYDLVAKGLFPRPVRISARAVGWLASEVGAWARERIAERDAAAPPEAA